VARGAVGQAAHGTAKLRIIVQRPGDARPRLSLLHLLPLLLLQLLLLQLQRSS